MIPIANFKRVPAKNPKNDPKPALTAVLVSDLLSNSPTIAPINGQITIPRKPITGKKMATNKPTVVPIMPFLLPPNFLAPIAGIT